MTGTNTGSFMGAPPSGRPMDISGIDVVRLVDGKCAEHWGAEGTLGLFTPARIKQHPGAAASFDRAAGQGSILTHRSPVHRPDAGGPAALSSAR